METAGLKKFALHARRTLISQVTTRMSFVLAEGSLARRENPKAIEQLETQIAKNGKAMVVETVAYTWFNRFCALRYMDVNRYTRIGIVSPAEGQSQPEILAEAKMGHLDDEIVPAKTREKVSRILDGTDPSSDPQGEAYRLLLVAACNHYHSIMPFMFESIADYTELLLPDDLLSGNSVLAQTRESLTEQYCIASASGTDNSNGEQGESVEVIGWLYQFYISDQKDAVMARKAAVSTDDIPAVTQLFTPHWIVRYLVENSLGRLWMLNHPDSRLREQMPYYIEGEAETDFLKVTKPEEIRLLDPACGSGHMLTYAYDLLYTIYDEQGYSPTEIPGLILKNNLFGIEICDRAAALAAFSLCMKARSNDSRYFRRVVQPNVISLQNVSITDDELEDYVEVLGLGELFQQPMLRLLHQFEEAKNFGSLIQPCLDERSIADARRAIEAKDLGGQLFLRETHLKVLRVLEQAEAITQRYHVVVENPPYCGSRYMNVGVSTLAKTAFKDGSGDMFAMFVLRSLNLVTHGGLVGVVCPFVWMFISTYKDFRRNLLANVTFESMVRLEYNGFEPACVPVSAWIISSKRSKPRNTCFIDLSDFKGIENQEPKTLEAIGNPGVPWRYTADCSDFLKLPTASFAYLVSSSFMQTFALGSKLGDLVDFTGSPNKTGDNGRFVRFWWEVASLNLGEHKRWVLYSKGGGNRKWWGLLDNVVDWSIDARTFYRENKTSNLLGEKFWFRPGIKYSMLTSNQPTFRRLPKGAVYDMGGPAFHAVKPEDEPFLLALCNSPFTDVAFDILNPTLNLQVSDVKSLPIPEMSHSTKRHITENTVWCEESARADWDNFETSWDFRDQPLLRVGLKGATLETSWSNWEAQSTAAIRRMQELETENNRLFIAAYGLEGELSPEVPEEQITLARADARHDMAAFLSHAVGCMLGRYSLDQPGLILANAGDTVNDYRQQVPEPTFAPDDDNVIPILDGDWFTDDISERFKEFLKVTFGTEHFEENLRFVENSLYPDNATAKKRKTVRDYFLKDFYDHHTKMYKKRPIYWLFSSPKGTFNALVYMHRYRPDTVSVVLQYLRDFRDKLSHRADHQQMVADGGGSTNAEKTKALKEVTVIKKQLKELEDYERDILFPLAQEKRSIDLDDGVKHNYNLFGKALKKITGLDS